MITSNQSNTLYSRHSLSHRDSPIITEYARSPREDTLPPLSPSTSPAGGGGGRREAAKLMLNGKRVVSPTKESPSHPSIHFLSSSTSFLPYTNAISRRRTLRKGREEGRLLSRMVRQLVFQVGRSSRSLQPGQCLHASLGFVKIQQKLAS